MTKEQIVQTLLDTKVVAVIRVDNADELVDTAIALNKGGVKALEITVTSPGAIDAIKEAGKRLGSEAIVGVGSVLDPETARMAILAGAQFVVGPAFSRELIEMCQRYSVVCIPGAYTPTEIVQAWQAGADFVKIFPASSLGPSFIKDIKGPLPQVRVTPTGGINLENAAEFIKAGASFVGVGGALVNKKLIAEKKWDELTALAKQYIDAVKDV
ncbi:MAG: bifunctional 4-hydroxy-2-oxoglutarate aldolase/2-dehydro-3-deoxy-phosphogluconate aldolase [Clostridiales bacterium]|jgi:2-dehydro-3-deoxyphosphogluconate aldolase/(4S)-4-hydroxy-2-oxoglutarate aldolase|nr:bifunctional 4-hydroxy-2-oxoglutarate aldolase/2-dehydro-3-deoxy-phosphogluconate aldolase [Clostridiales bacterium]